MAVEAPISINVNEVLPISAQVNATGANGGTPVDITGFSLEFVIHLVSGDGVVILRYTNTGIGGIVVPNPTSGVALITIPELDIASLGHGQFRYYYRRTDVGYETDYCTGNLTIGVV